MSLRTTAKAVTFDSTLEAFTFTGADDIYRFAFLEKACIKGFSQFQIFRGDPCLDTYFSQDLKRTQFGTRPALAVLLNSLELDNLLIWLLRRVLFLILGGF